MEYVEQFAETSTTKAQEAAKSATAAERAKTDTLAAKTEAVQAILQKNRPVWMPSAPQKATR